MKPGDLVYCWYGSFFDIVGLITENHPHRPNLYRVLVNGHVVEIDRLNLRLVET